MFAGSPGALPVVWGKVMKEGKVVPECVRLLHTRASEKFDDLMILLPGSAAKKWRHKVVSLKHAQVSVVLSGR